jgi:hypothetical protein
MQFNSIADLRANKKSPCPNELIYVLGYWTPGDSGGGEFFWNATSTAVDDGGVTIQDAQYDCKDTGRWIRVITTDKVSVRWFGAKGDNLTIDTAAFNNCATYIKGASFRRVMFIPDGTYVTGRVDITGVFTVEGNGPRVIVQNIAGEDIFYWKGVGEPGYVVATEIYISNLRLRLANPVDARPKYLRIGLFGERIGICAFHFPAVVGLMFDKIYIERTTGGLGAGFGDTGIFFSGAAYKVNFGVKTEMRGMDYGIICGTSETHNIMIPRIVSAFDPVTGTFTTAAEHGYTANKQVALIFDPNDGSIAEIRPRFRYYVVGQTPSTFRLATTPNGAAITNLTILGTPEIYVVPAGAHTIEYACDEWAANHLITANCRRVAFSVPNMAYGHINTWACQTSRVAIRIFGYVSSTRYEPFSCSFQDMFTEGPFDQAYMAGKEYVYISGRSMTIFSGPRMQFGNSTANAGFMTIATNYSRIDKVDIDDGQALKMTGDGNHITIATDGLKEVFVTDAGVNNTILFNRSTDGTDSARFISYYHKNTVPTNFGGFYPDYLFFGNPTTPYQGRGVLFYPATTNIYQGVTNAAPRFDDPSLLEVNGYVRFPTSGKKAIRSPLGSGSNKFLINQFFPKAKWKLYAKVRSLTTTQNISIGFERSDGGSGFASVMLYSVSTDWQVIGVGVDTTFGPDGMMGQIYCMAATEGFDLAFMMVVPYINTAALDGTLAPAQMGYTYINAVVDTATLTKTWLNTNYAGVPVGGKIIFTNLADAATNIAVCEKYDSADWFINVTLNKAV